MDPLRAPAPRPMHSVDDWWAIHRECASGLDPFAEAVTGGVLADRAGYAFASGYQAALHALDPDGPRDGIACLCATEEGGAHPRAIATALAEAAGGALTVTGRKKWATLGTAARYLLVVASAGSGPGGRNQLRVARILSNAPGVALRAMPAPPFAPEIPHAEIELASVRVDAHDILPGDGYERVLKPFRTLEDIFVQAALLAWLIRAAHERGFSRATTARMCALVEALRALAGRDPGDPLAHIALGGVQETSVATIAELDAEWATKPDEVWRSWNRDRTLLGVASRVRAQRLEAAWRRIDS